MRKINAFTMVELLVVTAIMAILIGGALMSMNSFNASQKIKAAKEQLVSNLKLARNYAKGMQTPVGVTGNLKYVTVSLGATLTITGVTDMGSGNFLSKKVVDDSTISFSPALATGDLCFAAYDTKLVDSSGNSVDIGKTLIVSSVENAGVTEIVVISSSGLINEK